MTKTEKTRIKRFYVDTETLKDRPFTCENYTSCDWHVLEGDFGYRYRGLQTCSIACMEELVNDLN